MAKLNACWYFSSKNYYFEINNLYEWLWYCNLDWKNNQIVKNTKIFIKTEAGRETNDGVLKNRRVII